MHKTENCLHTAGFYCVHGTQRSEFMRTKGKIAHTYAVRIIICFAYTDCCLSLSVAHLIQQLFSELLLCIALILIC